MNRDQLATYIGRPVIVPRAGGRTVEGLCTNVTDDAMTVEEPPNGVGVVAVHNLKPLSSIRAVHTWDGTHP